jgi:hypothetical protein
LPEAEELVRQANDIVGEVKFIVAGIGEYIE